MRALFRRPHSSGHPPGPQRLHVEVLEDRVVPATHVLPDIAVTAARLESPTVIQFDYRTRGLTGDFEVGVFRSADASFDAGDQHLATQTITVAAGGGAKVGRIDLGAELPIDPAQKYILIVADPDTAIAEQNENNNTAFFRKLVVGAVTHGFTLTGTAPAWISDVAAVLSQRGYDVAIPFDWSPLSHLPVPSGTVLAGQTLAAQVRQTARDLIGRSNDVVDVHLIGHSRGTSVISQAFRALELFPGPRGLQFGFYKQTLLDPHVARNNGSLAEGLAQMAANTGLNTVGQFSYNPDSLAARAFGVATLLFQEATNDPPAFVPANVDQAEMFYQQLAWDQTSPGTPDHLLGFNFLSPSPGEIPNFSGTPILFLDVGSLGLTMGLGIGHYSIPLWYLASGVPSLG